MCQGLPDNVHQLCPYLCRKFLSRFPESLAMGRIVQLCRRDKLSGLAATRIQSRKSVMVRYNESDAAGGESRLMSGDSKSLAIAMWRCQAIHCKIYNDSRSALTNLLLHERDPMRLDRSYYDSRYRHALSRNSGKRASRRIRGVVRYHGNQESRGTRKEV